MNFTILMFKLNKGCFEITTTDVCNRFDRTKTHRLWETEINPKNPQQGMEPSSQLHTSSHKVQNKVSPPL